MGVRLEEGLRGRTWRVGRRSGVKSWDAGDVASARGLEPLSLPLPGAQSRSCLRPTPAESSFRARTERHKDRKAGLAAEADAFLERASSPNRDRLGLSRSRASSSCEVAQPVT